MDKNDDDNSPPAKDKILMIDQVNEGGGPQALIGSQEPSSEPEGERSATSVSSLQVSPGPSPLPSAGDNVSKPNSSQDNLWDAIRKQKQTKIISDEESNRVGEGQVPSKSQVQRFLESCLRTATKRNLFEIIRKLIQEENVDPNGRHTNGITSIMIAADQGNVAVLQFLLPISDLTHVDNNLFTVLHHAARKNDERTIKILLSAEDQVDVNAQNKRGVTPLMIACTEGCVAVVKVLLDCPSLDVNIADSSGDTALLKACFKGNEAIVWMLLGHKDVQVNKTNINKDTALMIASHEEHPGVVSLLLNKRKILKSLKNYLSNTGSFMLTQSSALHTREGIDVNAQNVDNYTALMCACDIGNVEIVRSLLDHEDIDINLKDSNNETALTWACDNDRYKVISMLLQRDELDRSVINIESIFHVVKREVNKKDTGAVIEEAVIRNLPNIAVWLLKNEEYWDPEPEFHRSLFTIAAQEYDVNHLDVNKNKIKKGTDADVNVKKTCPECPLKFDIDDIEGIYAHWEDKHRDYDEQENPNPSPSDYQTDTI